MYCWYLLLLVILYLTPPSTSERVNGRHCCDREYQDFSDARLLSYRSLRDKLSHDRNLIRAPDIRTSRWKDTRDIATAYRYGDSKSVERDARHIPDRHRTERVPDNSNNANIYRLDTRNENYVRRDDTRNTFQKNNAHRREAFRRRLDSENGQIRPNQISNTIRKGDYFRENRNAHFDVERNPIGVDGNTEQRLQTRENTERRHISSRSKSSLSRLRSRQDDRNEVRRSKEFENIDLHGRLTTKRVENYNLHSNLRSLREIRDVRHFNENVRSRLQPEEKMSRVTLSRFPTDRRDNVRRSSLDSFRTRSLSTSPSTTTRRIIDFHIKDNRERQIIRSSVSSDKRDNQSDRRYSSPRTLFQARHRSSERYNSRHSTEYVSTRTPTESSARYENLSPLRRELRRTELNLNLRLSRSLPRRNDMQSVNERRALRSPITRFAKKRSFVDHNLRSSQDRDFTKNGHIHRGHRTATELQNTVRNTERRLSLVSLHSLETRRATLERYVSERRNIPTIVAYHSRRDSSTRRQFSGFVGDRRSSSVKHDNKEYRTDRRLTPLSMERQDTTFDTNIRLSRAASDIGTTRRSVDRRATGSQVERADTRQDRHRSFSVTTERSSRRADNRLVRAEIVSLTSTSTNKLNNHQRQLSSSMDRVNMLRTRERSETRRHRDYQLWRIGLESRRSDHRTYARDESRRIDVQRYGRDLRQDYRMSETTRRSRIVRDIGDNKLARLSKTTADRTNNRLSIVREISERVERSNENLIRQDSSAVLRRNVDRDLSHAIKFHPQQNDLKWSDRGASRPHRALQADARSKLERQQTHILKLSTNDKQTTIDYKDLRNNDGGSYILSWQHLFYIIQGLYLCSVFLQVHTNDENAKRKARNFGWWKPIDRVKLD